ncbi:hypothetical protein E3U43_021750 [Larimichthys crocea]|uniref:Uncharacterized protein n=1 Tax=Larimichthys crocea TaxID=215358 RepID=A0ACD3R7E3_LARCR|nr:hypothetical protein E3U43_021750 [Larimichthys crocea]
MEGNAAAPKKAIRHSHSLCPGEKKYVQKRKQKVMKRLNSLGVDCTANWTTAILSSGINEKSLS